MRILAVTPYYDPEGGGLERYADAILRRLATRMHEIEVVTMTRSGMPGGPRHAVGVERIRSRLAIGNAPLDPAFLTGVRERIRQHRPDIVVAHTPVPFAAEMADRAARSAGVPFVLTYHAGRLSGSSPPLALLAAIHRATFEARMLSRADGLIAVSPYVRDHALRRHAGRVAIIPPGVDTARFRSGGPPSGHGILFVAPLSRSYAWKGLDVLLQAFKEVRRRCPDATLTLVGDGDRRAELAAVAASHGAGAIRICGRLTDDGLVAEYDRAAVVVLPSTTDAESFGMVLAEANSCSRPVVASRVGGIPDFVRDGENGLLATPRDAGDLAAKILTVLLDDSLANALGAAGRRKVLADHDWNLLALRTQGVFEDVLQVAGR